MINTLQRWIWATAIGWLAAICLAYGQPKEETVRFRDPRLRAFVLELPSIHPQGLEKSSQPVQWIRARSLRDPKLELELGSRVVLQVNPGTDVHALLAETPLQIVRTLPDHVYILQAPDALTAARLSSELTEKPGVRIVHPIRRRKMKLLGRYAPMPDDPQFCWAWHLEDRDEQNGQRKGYDLCVRSAWPYTTGRGVVVAVADDGVELTHPDLSSNASMDLSYNFFAGNKNGLPQSDKQMHATAVAGIIAAASNNRRGACGVAPHAKICSWVVFNSQGWFLDEETAAAMFQYKMDQVWIQNHSWGNVTTEQYPLSILEDQAIQTAVTQGRHGRGVIIVRAAGNERADLRNTNDDGYSQDPRVITVGAVRNNGQPCSYTTPGATILVSAFSGDSNVELGEGLYTNYPTIFTTDRTGSLGYNKYDQAGLEDYAYGYTGFSGTSASTPQISGLCALLLSINPALTWRDVQQILILSSRQLYPADPDITINGGGFAVSHNDGFGVPDAGMAVQLARHWKNRPEPVTITVSTHKRIQIPDDGLRVEVHGDRLPQELASIPAWPIDGTEPDDGLPEVPLVDVGQALTPIQEDLHGKAALIKRGGNYFVQKLRYAKEAGAVFAIIYNNTGGTERVIPSGGDIQFIPIPAVFIDQIYGETLAAYLAQNPETTVSVHMLKAVYELPVEKDLLCEHVALRVQTTHTRRADLRICLVSPSGTRSVLQRINNDFSSPLDDWTYYSVHHFFESSYGTWRVEVVDERPGVIGAVKSLELTITGVPISDQDHDGLDDHWEMGHFGSLNAGPREDPDQDGFTNMKEFLMNSDPLTPYRPFQISFGWWKKGYLRLYWPSTPQQSFTVWSTSSFDSRFLPKAIISQLPGQPFETDLVIPVNQYRDRFFWVERKPRS